ncbi:hypothetical protein C0Q70_03223 [Pomacea canaliculata]|uniref:Mammalian ependymin-related protein 1 n=1 Tax=Pomacea canaliculata TaxID=400727 RepID=A0A2T7PS50_POMCA|nr:uncharacterized protein LOC112556783 [Pomacea canaliculata]PVD36245.1 hypothetical protein C0Q70_03223 [Pomacea canaliculata]
MQHTMWLFLFLALSTQTGWTFKISSFLSPTTPASDFCVAKEFIAGQAIMSGTLIDGKQTISKRMTMMAYSAKLKKVQFRDLPSERMPYGRRVLFDYPAETLYTVTYHTDINATCTKRRLLEPFKEECMPENSTIVFSDTLYGAGAFTTVGWEITGTMDGGVRFHVSMTNEHLPMFEETYGVSNGRPFFQNVFFYNASLINFHPDDYIFRPPKNCTFVTWS